MRNCVIGCAVVLLALGIAVADEMWETPYSAAEIREAWALGFWLETSNKTAEGEQIDRIEVVEWSKEGAVLKTGHGEGSQFPVTWEQLRSHALFDKANTTRSRETRTTPLGTFEGWLFKRSTDEGHAEFFFADDLPGPPVAYEQTGVDGESILLSVQVARRGIESSP
jgi:hypothetical protein